MAARKNRLVYSIWSEGGQKLSFSFPLHPHTVAPEHVGEVMDVLLDVLDREVSEIGATNGDVLQALAMALACRAAVMDGSVETNTALADDLAQEALAAARASLAADNMDRSDEER
ncbi:hypothetical protein [Pedomonas mirosovicensis]|uniref:hypothetical protein n=1 Tax=Pedomonas mirosovicensis TaxID=2908641 RepID=UPI00216A82DD|nr:hypothetical protein [Pedomonas mirosovicensis]MCH8685513.1 hypothetical protein [Pedomonas mirosovicensis]